MLCLWFMHTHTNTHSDRDGFFAISVNQKRKRGMERTHFIWNLSHWIGWPLFNYIAQLKSIYSNRNNVRFAASSYVNGKYFTAWFNLNGREKTRHFHEKRIFRMITAFFSEVTDGATQCIERLYFDLFASLRK